ncbi:Methyltransferase small domain-containing protein [Pedococcus dokdonensis]|uniref:Methyltransferase small domain-containing protein n=1 Tax=Pedococcus dokdonensis TaxID=443156 RepID=A0A1H0Q8E8_9MICO|nr:methyltransferase [Pedococcus dokdonensis]SDP12929.1 Methyltransferase small domain-containing protein [Pedococcus dokdonensis]
MNSQDHYFTAEPASPAQQRTITVRLAGQTVEVRSAAGVFSPAGVDQGTAVLLRHAPAPSTRGTLLDLGCGWGPIALTLALRSPEATVYAVDVNERALDLLRTTAESLGLDRVHAGQPDGIPDGLQFDAIWSNPPIRVGKAVLHDLLLTWLPRLAPGGVAYLVVQKNLGSDSLQRWLTESLDPEVYAVSRLTSDKGFRILEVRRAG